MYQRTGKIRERCFITMATLLAGITLALLPSGAWAFATFITGNAHVSDTFTGFGGGEDSVAEIRPLNGSPLFGTASLGGGSATYNLQPAGNAASISGQSNPVSFLLWVSRNRESQADAYMQLSDRFTVTAGGTGFTFRVNWTGALMPNTDFETQYASAFGTTTVTARAILDLTYGFISPTTGNIEFPYHKQVNLASNQGVGEFETSVEQFLGCQGPAGSLCGDFGYILTIGGVGSRGGGFSFLGTSGIASGLGSGLLAAFPDGDLLDHSFFEIVVELPPGVSISGGSGYYIRQVTVAEQVLVPEPASLWLLALGSLALLWFVCRRRHSAGGF